MAFHVVAEWISSAPGVALILRTINQSHLQFNKPVFSLLKNFLEVVLMA